MDISVLNSFLAIITLALGGALIVYMYEAYKLVRQKSILLLIYGVFTIIIGIALPDIVSIFFQNPFALFWAEIFSRFLAIIGICVIIFSILRG
jgi:CDP-diglyceride synthetase